MPPRSGRRGRGSNPFDVCSVASPDSLALVGFSHGATLAAALRACFPASPSNLPTQNSEEPFFRYLKYWVIWTILRNIQGNWIALQASGGDESAHESAEGTDDDRFRDAYGAREHAALCHERKGAPEADSCPREPPCPDQCSSRNHGEDDGGDGAPVLFDSPRRLRFAGEPPARGWHFPVSDTDNSP